MGSEIGSFAHRTVTVRLPEIARRVIQENRFPTLVNQRIGTLIGEMTHQSIRYLNDPGAPDESLWNRAITPHLGKSWLDVPWFFSETYFYRRVLEATGFFMNGEGQGIDPYRYQKKKGLESPIDETRKLCQQVNHLVGSQINNHEMISRLLLVDLWANQVDLSLWPVDQAERPDHDDPGSTTKFLLVDDRDIVASHVVQLATREQPHKKIVDFLIDNAGFELVCDCCLADVLLSKGLVDQVCFHLKIHPTFVSDATIMDVQETINYLADHADRDISRLGGRLVDAVVNNVLVLADHSFWTSPFAMWELPADLRETLSKSSLVISKGDANYRRLLGDRHWDDSERFEKVVSYFNSNLVAMRTLKSDVLVGLPPDKDKWLDGHEPDWRTNGRWGIIQARLSIE